MDGDPWDQPDVPYDASYPYNHVYESESGHVQEFDDTPGHERIHTYHRSGTFDEMDADGSRVQRIVGDSYEIVDRNGYIYIMGKANVTVDGTVNIYVKNNVNLQVDGDLTGNVKNDVDLTVQGAMNLNVKRKKKRYKERGNKKFIKGGERRGNEVLEH